MINISKEQDYVSDLADHGVSKYDYDIGRFTSTDVLFEKYYGWSAYQYSANNPINMLDWNGNWAREVAKDSHAIGTVNRNSNGFIAEKNNYEFYEKWTSIEPIIEVEDTNK